MTKDMHFYCNTCEQIVEGRTEFIVEKDGSADPEITSCPHCGETASKEDNLATILSTSTLCGYCKSREYDVVYSPYCSSDCKNLADF